MKRIVLSLLLVFAVGCAQPELHTKPSLVDEGEVYLYLQPVPEAYQQLRFTIGSLSAYRQDGAEVPLNLTVAELDGATLIGKQRLLASGLLPPGTYSGLSMRVTSAVIRGDSGESALFLPETPIRVVHSFKVIRKKATPLFLAFDPAGGFTIGVRFAPAFSIQDPRLPPVDLIGYVSCAESNIVSMFNKKTMQVVDVAATGKGPKGMVLDQRRRKVYVALSGEDALIVIDVLTGEITNRLSLNFGDEPTELAITPDGRTLVAVNTASNTASIIDAVSLVETNKVKVGNHPTSAAINPVASRAFITDALSNTVSVVDLNQQKLLTALTTGATPLRAVFNERDDRLYIINRDSPDMTVVAPASLTVTQRIFTGMGAISIGTADQTGLIYVGKRFGNEIAVIDPRSSMFIDQIGIAGTAAYLEIDARENSLFVVLPDRNVLQKVNITSKRIVSEIEVGEGAYAVVVMGKR
jgi:YVTN family beta-propeller protein